MIPPSNTTPGPTIIIAIMLVKVQYGVPTASMACNKAKQTWPSAAGKNLANKGSRRLDDTRSSQTNRTKDIIVPAQNLQAEELNHAAHLSTHPGYFPLRLLSHNLILNFTSSPTLLTLPSPPDQPHPPPCTSNRSSYSSHS